MPATASPGIARIACASRDLLALAAQGIVECERESLPDLTRAVVLIPDPHAVQDVARALREAAGLPAVLLPRITTLVLWAAEVPLERPVAARAAREAFLYQELKKHAWLASADLWAVSAELAGLFDEMTRSRLALPADFAAFNRQLEKAYRAKSGDSLTFEARIVHELWHVVSRVAGEADAESAYQLRLARLAAAADAPLYVLGLSRLAPEERRFLERYAVRAAVQVYEPDPDAGTDAVTRTLAAAWPRAAGSDGLRARGYALKATHPQSALVGRLRVIGAAGAEQEAQAVDATVRGWLLAGKKRIAIVVQDRLTARRARALLERAQVLVKDEAGWAFSTTSAATAVGRWLDVAGGDCYHRDLLDLLKSPFAFHDWEGEARRQAVWRLEGYVRSESVVAGLANFIKLAEDRNDPGARQMLARVRQGVGALGRGGRPIARWLAALSASLGEIGVREGLAADSAGAQLLELIERLARELEPDRFDVSFTDWRRWLSRQLEAATFRDRSIESPVVFTNLAATPLRGFDAVLVLGCDAAHLPGPDPVAMFFNQGVRAELALPTWGERVREMEEQLAALIASCDTVAVTWQRMLGGEHNLLSPFIERLDAVHQQAYGSSLREDANAGQLAQSEVLAPGAAMAIGATRQPAPSVPVALLPRRISASGYNALVACPYQFHARYVLGLAELDDVQEMIEKKDYGSLVHGVLTRFHGAHPRVSAMEPAVAARELEEMSEQAFAPVVARNYLAQAWLARWKSLVPGYIEWQRAREAEGWAFQAGEADRSVEMMTAGGVKLTLRGRLDRVDSRQPSAAGGQETGSPSPITRHSSLDYAVIDYKTRAARALEQSLAEPGEDVQLPVYALLWQAPVSEALFLSLDREEVKTVGLDQDVGALAESVRERLCAMFDALAAGAPLPAQGVEAACEYCEARGLCRRNYWP